jgi:hypothetical protein
MVSTIHEEVHHNAEAFRAHLPQLLATHRGQVALLRHQTIIGFFDTARDAYVAGQLCFADDKLFSIQEVAEETPINLGLKAHVTPLRTV